MKIFHVCSCVTVSLRDIHVTVLSFHFSLLTFSAYRFVNISPVHTCSSNVGYSVLYGNLPCLICSCVTVSLSDIYVSVLNLHFSLLTSFGYRFVIDVVEWLLKKGCFSRHRRKSRDKVMFLVQSSLIFLSPIPSLIFAHANATEANSEITLTIRKPNMTLVYI